jgi:thiamine pyrophosphokinase
MKRCIIFAGGDPEPRIPDGLETDGALIIAADRGYRNCKELGIVPNLAVGDYDSLNFVPDDCEHLTFPKEKDDTDLMLAVREAISRGCGDITVVGAMGGRFDHTFANVQTLAFIRSHGAWGRILSCRERITLVTPGSYEVEKIEGFSLSLFSYSENVGGLTVRGVKYPVDGGRLVSDFPLGVSNEITADRAEITFDEGLLLSVNKILGGGIV